jgi:hypothetical protein
VSFTRKVGNKIQRTGGMVCEIKLLAPYQAVVEGSNGKLFLINDTSWYLYSDVPSFYEVDQKYKFASGWRTDTWKILDIYQVDNPEYGDEGKLKAVAKMITATGTEDIQTLTMHDFKRMVKV